MIKYIVEHIFRWLPTECHHDDASNIVELDLIHTYVYFMRSVPYHNTVYS